MHLFDKSVGMAGSSAICAGAPPLAAGAALTAQLLKKDYVSTVFFGDGASEEGSLWETLNFSALKKLPVIFFCENNPKKAQVKRNSNEPFLVANRQKE